jgi:MFS family permease
MGVDGPSTPPPGHAGDGESRISGGSRRGGLLVVARAIQGVAGALMYPQVLAVIQVAFSGAERTRTLASC